MRKLLAAALVGLVVCLAAPAQAGLVEGMAAYKRGDYATALREWRPLADQGIVGAQNNLGVMYENGKGVTQNYGEAVRWYRKAANQGHADAQNNLGFMCENGKGVPQDYAEGVRWYHKAAEQGHATAQYNLGVMYYKGRSVPRDYVQAHMWYNLAATTGDKDAVKYLDIVAGRMTPAQLAKARRLAKEWMEKHQGK